MSDESVRLALRVHDECNGSDVFGSDICTCRPYLIYGIEEAVKEAQKGGSGVVIYFRKEGRALGEVTKVVFPSQNLHALIQADYVVSCLQCQKARRGSGVRVLQENRKYCRCERYEIPRYGKTLLTIEIHSNSTM
jgi:GTP cyclohydrolase II